MHRFVRHVPWGPLLALALLVAVALTVPSAPARAVADDPADPSPTSTTSTPTTTTTTTTTTTSTPATSTTSTTTTSTTTSTTSTTTTTASPSATTSTPSPSTPNATNATNATSTTTTLPTPDVQPGPAALNVTALPDQIGYILATIRHLESRGIYDLPPNRGRASGAYQYITSTWANHAGYPHAYLAPPWVQDERAAADVLSILARFGNDVSMIPVIWYFPAAVADPALLDTVPKPEAGNVLTIREYQRRWLQVFAFVSGGPIPPITSGVPPGLESLSGMPPDVPEAGPDSPISLAFPVLGPVTLAPPEECERACDDATSTVVIFGRTMQPVLAAADGVVTAVQPADPVNGDVRLMITDTQGFTYRYSGLNDDTPGTNDGIAPLRLRFSTAVEVGNTVRAGQIIGFMGNSDPVPTDHGEHFLADGHHVWPHLRFGVTDANGNAVDAYGPLIDAVFRQSCTVGIGQWSVPATTAGPTGIGGSVAAMAERGGGWTILPSGEVHAIGEAALIHPTAACQWAPDEAYGPGARGSADVPEGFHDEVVLPVGLWLTALKDGGEVRPGAPLRRG